VQSVCCDLLTNDFEVFTPHDDAHVPQLHCPLKISFENPRQQMADTLEIPILRHYKILQSVDYGT